MNKPMCPKCGRTMTKCTTQPPIYVCTCFGAGCSGAMSEVEYLKAENELLRQEYVRHLEIHNQVFRDLITMMNKIKEDSNGPNK